MKESTVTACHECYTDEGMVTYSNPKIKKKHLVTITAITVDEEIANKEFTFISKYSKMFSDNVELLKCNP